MMNLLKYDFKRNGTKLLGIFAVLLLLQISLMLFVKYVEIKLTLSILAYVIAGVMLFTTTIRTYSYNLKAYHRKLLPVHTLKSILSPILMGCICLLGLGLITVIHGYVYLSMYGNPQMIIDLIKTYPVHSIFIIFKVFLIIIYLLIAIFFAITIAASIRIKGSFWIVNINCKIPNISS
ncbi:flagellar biosynthesis protein FlhB [Paenibacillus sp. DS2015]|uniref:hypothetical protein n=1 Tax=Paenibacillus sp. DS2015 TaxID=3373917 RepID=UPI003D2442EE